MRNDSRDIIRKIGETDQQYLNQNTPELALERADLRLELVTLSRVRQEQVHFLQEAIVLLEQARLSFEEMPMKLYVALSLHLAKAYMIFFEITHEDKYALIVQQVLKELLPQNITDVFFFLAYASAVKQEPAMTRHWLTKYVSSTDYDLELVKAHHAFKPFHTEPWFIKVIQTKVH